GRGERLRRAGVRQEGVDAAGEAERGQVDAHLVELHLVDRGGLRSVRVAAPPAATTDGGSAVELLFHSPGHDAAGDFLVVGAVAAIAGLARRTVVVRVARRRRGHAAGALGRVADAGGRRGEIAADPLVDHRCADLATLGEVDGKQDVTQRPVALEL